MFLHSVIIVDSVDKWCLIVQYINEVETSTNATRASVTTDLRDCELSSHRCATRFCLAPYLRYIFFLQHLYFQSNTTNNKAQSYIRNKKNRSHACVISRCTHMHLL